jgi:pimeloyl-ACP methyl ester carboxylesterase
MHARTATFLQALNRFAAVLTYDRRGYGRSAPLRPASVTAQAAAADLHPHQPLNGNADTNKPKLQPNRLLDVRSWFREVATISKTTNLNL